VSRDLEHEIEAVFRDRTGRECLFVPSGRLALLLAFRAWLRPGSRILMSALEDDTVFIGALVAGLRPVMAPLSLDDGNIDVGAIPDATWSSLDGVLAMNLYGLPDRLVELRAQCDRLGIPLIEDAAHALQSEAGGRPVGTFGDVAAFSLTKHFPGAGGVLALADPTRRSELEGMLAEATTERPLRRRAADELRSASRMALNALPFGGAIRHARQARQAVRRTAWRMPLRPTALREALAAGDLSRFDQWMTIGAPDYRMPLPEARLERTIGYLRDLARDRRHRTEGVERLRELEPAASGTRDGPARALLRVPLLVEDRDATATELQRRGLRVYFLYAPPLDDYAPGFTEPSPEPAVARHWASHVLPVDPLDAGRILDAVDAGALRPVPAMPLP
jgi:hypothetical protein